MSLHRRKGGALDIGKKTIVVRYEGRDHTVSWFSGASDEAISRAIDSALGFPRGTPAVIRDPEDGSALAISDSLPDGLTLDATPVKPADALSSIGGGGLGIAMSKLHKRGGGAVDESSALPRSDDGFHNSSENATLLKGNANGGSGGDGGSGSNEGGGNNGRGAGGGAKEFRGELLKFERVNAHLANERTWLAWVRTALSVLGVALSLLSLMDDMGTVAMDSLALVLGVAFVVCTLFTYMTGWLRYTRVKKVLTWTSDQVKGSFGRFGLQYFTRFLGVSLVLTVPLYLYGGVTIVKDA
ncbi:unnamed protein product [Ascophyllum nodosum]